MSAALQSSAHAGEADHRRRHIETSGRKAPRGADPRVNRALPLVASPPPVSPMPGGEAGGPSGSAVLHTPEDIERLKAREWSVCTFAGARDRVPHREKWGHDSLIRELGHLKLHHGDKLQARAWSPVVPVRGTSHRLAANAMALTCLVFDLDAGNDLADIEGFGDEFIRYGHTSWSHHPDKPKARAVFPLRTNCLAEMWPEVWAAGARWAGCAGLTVDPAVKDPFRLYFTAVVPDTIEAREWFESWAYGPADERSRGRFAPRHRRLLSWRWLLEHYPPPERTAPAPVAMTGSLLPTVDVGEEDQEKRGRFGAGLIRYRADRIARQGEGGRNSALYGAGRVARGLELAGAVNGAAACQTLIDAGVAAGLSEKEATTAVQRGFHKGWGDSDEPYPLHEEMGP